MVWSHDSRVPCRVTDGRSKFCTIDPAHGEVAVSLLNEYHTLLLESRAPGPIETPVVGPREAPVEGPSERK